jgi:hypothetical protein
MPIEHSSEGPYQEGGESIQRWNRETVIGKHPCTEIKLIEEVSIQIHGVIVVSCMCMLNGMFIILLFLLYICFLCYVWMISY